MINLETRVIEYYVKRRYGRDDRVLVDKDFENILSRVTGKKTLDNVIISAFEQLGFTFQVVVEPGLK